MNFKRFKDGWFVVTVCIAGGAGLYFLYSAIQFFLVAFAFYKAGHH